jgi:hypothetical protein
MRQTEILTHNFNLYSDILETLQNEESILLALVDDKIKNITKLPTMRDKAYPSGGKGTESDIEAFQLFLADKTNNGLNIRNREANIVKIKKTLSAIRYHNFILNEVNIIKEKGQRIVASSFNTDKDLFECSTFFTSTNEIVFKEVPKEEIDFFLKTTADKVVFFPLLVLLDDVYTDNISGIEKKDNSIFTSIQDILKYENEFQLKDIGFYKDLFDSETKDNYSDSLLALFRAISGL